MKRQSPFPNRTRKEISDETLDFASNQIVLDRSGEHLFADCSRLQFFDGCRNPIEPHAGDWQ
jgi:hypothetical protein